MATGGLVATEVRTTPSGKVIFAAVGSTAPTSSTSTLSSSWHEAGFLDNDSVSLSPDVSASAIMKWQTPMPVKYSLDEVSMEVKFVMNQVNQDNTSLYFFGAQWTNLAAGQSKMIVPASPNISDLERALVVEFTDDRGDATRWYFARGIVIERDELTLNKGDIKLGVTYHVMASGTEMFEIFSSIDELYSS